jgi:hypothetical protein
MMARMNRLAHLAILVPWILSAASAEEAKGSETATRRETGPDERTALKQALEPLHAQFNPVERMLRRPFSSPGYHTTLKGGWVHPTRDALNYAVACLDTGESELGDRAQAILDRVLDLQDTDAGSRTYGIWPWFLEESLEQMSPPDWNWADFCGVALLQVALDHAGRLDPELRDRVDAAIRHAARSIQRRNVGPAYTNIAIMGTYVTLVAGELYGDAVLAEYGAARLRRFYEYTQHHGAFTEYNSPTYTVVALRELGRLLAHVRDSESRGWVEWLYRLAWEEIAVHFHAPTRQWSGPHSRAYSTRLPEAVLALIQRGTEGRVDFGAGAVNLESYRIPLLCPAEFEGAFRATEPRTFQRAFLREMPPLVGTTHLEAAYTLGSINRGDLWNQRRPLLAYWGMAEKVGYLRLRLLRDGYDFAAGQFFSQQGQGRVLGAVIFATDGGQTHVSLDRMQGGRTEAADFRLRFEFGGLGDGVVVEPPREVHGAVNLQVGELRIGVAVAYAAFGAESLRWEVTREGEITGLDLVMLDGGKRTLDFGALERAAVGLMVQLGCGEPPELRADAVMGEGLLRLRSGDMTLAVPVRPGPARELMRAVRWGAEAGGASRDRQAVSGRS